MQRIAVPGIASVVILKIVALLVHAVPAKDSSSSSRTALGARKAPAS